MGEVIKKIGELRPSDVHKLQQLYNYGADVDNIVRKLSKASEKNIEEIYEIFDIVAKENYSYAEPFYKAKGKKYIPYEENESLQKYVKSMAKQTVGEYVNLTQHTAFAVFDKGDNIAPLFEANNGKVATSISDTYTKVVDYAVTKAQIGATDYNSAMRSALKALADSGIRTVDYATGYSRRLDSAVRQNILWGIKECNQNTADMIGEEFGADGYEISYHSHPRPSHEDMGGKTFAIGKARTVNGIYYPSFDEKAEPLLKEYGCLHFKFSVLLGVSESAYTNEQLEQLKADDKKTFEFEGKQYTKYDASQMMSTIESRVKKLKDRANIATSAGDEDLRQEVQYKINIFTNKYAQLSKASGLPTKMEKMRVAGFKRTKGVSTSEGQAKYKAIINRKQDEKQYEKYISILGKENMPETFDKFQFLKYNNIEVWDFVKLDYSRQLKLINHPELSLPNAHNAYADDRKYTGYLFNPSNDKGYAKGKAFTSRLGYDINNYEELKKCTELSANKYPARFVCNNGYGDQYEQKIVLYGHKGKPANVVVGWIVNGSETKLTSMYIKER